MFEKRELELLYMLCWVISSISTVFTFHYSYNLVCLFTGQPLNINAAYSGRIACAYKYGKSFTRPSRKDPDSRYVNLCVAIYECESTGGRQSVILCLEM